LAHEIKNPLSTIKMNLELISEELLENATPSDRRMLKKISTVQLQCELLQGVLDAFLQFARAGELHLETTDLTQLVSEFIKFYQPQADEKQIEISPHLGTDLPLVHLDRSLMRQVLMNLALNAQQAMPEGGRLELQTFVDCDQVFLVLIDNGQGMTERAKSKMFHAFFSTKPGGSGLGLPTVRKIIEAHHGTIQCESEVGRGTRFSISLPHTTKID
jgi:signal transduction histidine kinase